MATHTKGIDLYRAQKARLEKSDFDMRRGHWDVARKSEQDALELLSGQPFGRARQKLLRQLGHPFGRRSLASVLADANAATAAGLGDVRRLSGRRREVSKDALKKAGLKGNLPSLPIGMIGGRLRRSMRLARLNTSRSVQDLGLGAPGIPYAKFILGTGGTRKMIDRGFQREIQRRWRPRNKAFVDWVRAQQRKP